MTSGVTVKFRTCFIESYVRHIRILLYDKHIYYGRKPLTEQLYCVWIVNNYKKCEAKCMYQSTDTSIVLRANVFILWLTYSSYFVYVHDCTWPLILMRINILIAPSLEDCFSNKKKSKICIWETKQINERNISINVNQYQCIVYCIRMPLTMTFKSFWFIQKKK